MNERTENGKTRWNRLIARWRQADRADWAFLCGRGDLAAARRWGFVMAAGVAAMLAASAAGVTPRAFAAMNLRFPAMVLACAFAALGALAAKGKPWASPSLLALFPGTLLAIIIAAVLRPGHWGWSGPEWAVKILCLLASVAVWVRVYALVHRTERRQRPSLAAGDKA